MVLDSPENAAATQRMVLEPRGCLNHRLLLLFLRHGTPDWAKGRRKDCAFVGALKDFRIFNEDIKSLL